MSLFDDIAAIEDVEEILLTIPEWNDMVILFRGMTFEMLMNMEGTFDIADMKEMETAPSSEKLEQMVKLIAMTAYDPADKTLLFDTDEKIRTLKGKSYKALLRMIQDGATVVLGTDEAETAGKDLSSTAGDDLAQEDSSSKSPERQVEQSEN